MSGMVEVAQATVTLIPTFEQGTQGKITKELSGVDVRPAGAKMGASLGSGILASVKKHAGAIAGVLTGIGVAKFAKSSVEAFTSLASQTKGLQRVMGGTAESVSGMTGAMRLSGMDAEKASTCMTIFSKKVQAAAGDADKMKDVADGLGVAVYDAEGKVRPMNELLPQIADRFAGMEDGAAKTALACQYFGKSGTAMLPFLNKGSAGIAELTAKAKEMGIVIDDEAMSKFSAYKGAIREWQMSLEGAQVAIGSTMAPMVTAAAALLTTTFVPAIQEGARVVSDFFTGLTSTVDVAGIQDAVSGVSSAFLSAFPSDGGDVSGFGQAAGAAINGVKDVLQAMEPYARTAGEALKWCADNANWLAPAALGVVVAIKGMQMLSGAVGVVRGIGSALGVTAAASPAAAAGLTATAGAETAAGTAAGGAASSLFRAGAAILMIGGGVALACAGIALLAQSAIALSNAGGMAVPILIGMGAGLLVMVGVFALLGPALNVAVPGMLAFGAAVLMAGAGAALLGAGVMMAGMGVAMIADNGGAAADALLAMAPAMLAASPALAVFGGACLVTSGALLALGAGALTAGAGLLTMGAGALLVGAGVMVMGAGLMVAAVALTLITTAARAAGAVLPLLGKGAQAAAPGVTELGAACAGAALGLLAAVPGVTALALGVAGLAVGSVASAAAFGLMAAAVGAIAGLSGVASGALTMLKGAMDSLPPSVSRASSTMSQAASSFNSALASMGTRTALTLARIRSEFANMQLHIPSPTLGSMPHFRLNGEFNLEKGQVPTIDVDWYAKGGVFDRPSIIGVGEKGSEAVLPLNDSVLGRIADGISANSKSGGTFNFNISGAGDPEKVASSIASRIRRLQRMGAI